MKWLDSLPYGILVFATILMALAPFSPQPHLWEKWQMLLDGSLRRPIDAFDLFWHMLPGLLLALKWWRGRQQ